MTPPRCRRAPHHQTWATTFLAVTFTTGTGQQIRSRSESRHPPIRQLHDHWPSGDAGGLSLPIKPTHDDPAKPVDGVLYLNTFDRKLSVYANGAWRSLQSW